jgi:hypothetical protein
MKIFRGPRTTRKWSVTDDQPVVAPKQLWRPGHVTRFDGTIAKYGGRHTDLGVEINVDDVTQLVNGLVAHHQSLGAQVASLEADCETLRIALDKISSLALFHQSTAPSVEELLSAIGAIAGHYQFGATPDAPPDPSWVRFSRI